MATIIVRNNPFDSSDTEIHRPDEKIFIDWLKNNYPHGFPRATKIYCNGDLVEVENYDFELKEDTLVSIQISVEDPGTITFIFIVATVSVAATYIALQLMPDPDNPSSFEQGGSPTYGVRGQSNRARIGEPVPVIYGKHLVYPDLAAQPWTEYVVNDQFLYQLFCIGNGEYDIDEIRIGETDINTFTEIETEIVLPGSQVTLFNDNVVTSPDVSNVFLPASNEFLRKAFTSGPTFMTFDGTTGGITLGDLNDSLQKPWSLNFSVGEKITLQDVRDPNAGYALVLSIIGEYTVKKIVNDQTIEVEEDTSGWSPNPLTTDRAEVVISSFLEGPVAGQTASHIVGTVGQTLQEILFDFEFPSGLYDLDSNNDFIQRSVTMEIAAVAIDANGDPIAGGFSQTFTMSGTKRSPLRETFKYPSDVGAPALTNDRYTIRLKRNTESLFNANAPNELYWTGLKGELLTVSNYGQFTMLATKVKATNQINSQLSKKFNMVVTRKLPIWNGSSWSNPTATRSIAWALADAWMNVYGGSRSYLEIDLGALLALDSTWTTNGDYFDAIFDQTITLWEAIQRIARVGRARPVLNGNILTFIRDESQTVRTAMFNMRNITKDSFNIEYNFDDYQAPDGIKLTYFDNDNWKELEIFSNPNASRPKAINLFGCTEYEQAWREATYLDAVQKYQRKRISFTTELEGHIPMVGDLISVSHDMPEWGQSGEVNTKTGLTITTSEPLDFSAGGTHLIIFRKLDGSVSTPVTITEGSTDNEGILATDPGISFQLANTREKTYYSFGPSSLYTQDCVITEVVPRGNKKVQIKCLNYDSRIHTADQATIPPKPTVTQPVDPIPPVISGLIATNAPNSGVIVCTWNPAYGINNYVVETSTDNVTFTPHSEPTINTANISATGLLYIRVASKIVSTVGEFTTTNIVSS